jgi:hypothetical protein
MIRDHLYRGNCQGAIRDAETRSAHSLPCEFDIVAQMRLQVHGADGNFEGLRCTVLRHSVIPGGTTKASFDARLFGRGRSRGGLA